MKKIIVLFVVLFSVLSLAKPRSKTSSLALAIQSGDFQTVKKLVNHGANVNQHFGTIGETPLTLAALNGRAKTVEYLIKHNADINAKTKNGMTALFFASYGSTEGALKPSFDQPNYTEVIKILVGNGADVNIQDERGETALDVAKQNHRSAEILKLLTPQ